MAGLLTTAVQAHVTLAEPQVLAGAGYKAVLRVGHGCEGSATHTLKVLLPAGFRGAKPMPKPGWALRIRRDTLAEPYESHGRRVTEDVVEITWQAATR
jgi:periplasmic copper chaperone A